MKNYIAIILGKLIYLLTQILHLGAGGTWPGEVATGISPNILSDLTKSLDKGAIIVAGTNGKTTTSLMIKQILEKAGNRVIHNSSGANLLNGVVSALIQETDWLGKIKADWGVFEVDENSLPLVVSQFRIQNLEFRIIIVLLNLFRDQLDRYGEVDVIVEKWGKALKKLPENSTLILNSDDPGVAWVGRTSPFPLLGKEKVRERWMKIIYFGLNDPKLFIKTHEHATDSTFCLNCGARLTYSGIFYSHLGHWKCPKCSNKRADPDISKWPTVLPGIYNQYNTLAAVAVAKSLNIKDTQIKSALNNFQPAFGRQEEFDVDGKKIKIFLSKNPAGFNASLRTVLELMNRSHSRPASPELQRGEPDRESFRKDSRFRENDKEGGKDRGVILLALNDRIPDGRDVSWIWDVDFETIPENAQIIISGDRAYDLGLRIKYTGIQNENLKFRIEEKLDKAISYGLNVIDKGEMLFILPTYSAMLEIRKIITGKKIM